ncbi:glycosyltransferase family 2 protein [Paenibacillus graminis]|uniref:glycosyltransferase family 2 protein n=1 Tax=Paenibacillus graminis TaxID=189425 RepID=UPI002DBD1E6B|nr:glycosyltransferase family 2 protein [Paenibacillus graminis]MEC0169778.1 glycosyltransferase family 2 protein [Paenibacillus graminis]
MKIMGGIILFNPDIQRLKENVNSISSQVDLLYMIDNCSSNVEEIERMFNDVGNIIIVKNAENNGVAKALNQIMALAMNQAVDWVLTLDQDSICPHDLIEKCLRYIKMKNIGIICPEIIDSKVNILLTERNIELDYEFVNRCITSAALTNVEICRKVGFFNDELFIDYVDFDYCAKLRINNYKILRMNDVTLNHQLGDSKLKSLFFREFRVTNHTAFRKYYIARNITYYIRKYRKEINVNLEYLRIIKVLIFTMLFESDKKEKIKNLFRGIIHGMKMKI